MATVISCVNFCEGATNYTPIKKKLRQENGDIMHWIYYTSKNLASRLWRVPNESSTEIQFTVFLLEFRESKSVLFEKRKYPSIFRKVCKNVDSYLDF